MPNNSPDEEKMPSIRWPQKPAKYSKIVYWIPFTYVSFMGKGRDQCKKKNIYNYFLHKKYHKNSFFLAADHSDVQDGNAYLPCSRSVYSAFE